MSVALAIFVKTPGLSPIKTRLAAGIGVTDAERFHLLAAKAVAEVATATKPEIVPYWAVAESAGLESVLWQDFARVWQGQGDLGARLHCVCAQLSAAHDRVLLVGADAPQITVALLRQALSALDDPATPFVLGRAADGGFWLFGTRNPVSIDVWRTPRYSTPDTADELSHALATQDQIAHIAMLNDVDNQHDAIAVMKQLRALPQPLPAQSLLCDWLQRRFNACLPSTAQT